mgnify:FL=1
MRPAVGIIRGPSLYRHACAKCAEETLHNYLGCTRCETYPFGKLAKLPSYLRNVVGNKSHARKGRPE